MRKKSSQIFFAFSLSSNLSLSNFFFTCQKYLEQKTSTKGSKKQHEEQIDVQSLTFHIELIHNQTGVANTKNVRPTAAVYISPEEIF